MHLKPKSIRGFVLAVSAPSGTGKTSLCDKLAREFDFVRRSISVTTRPQREGEVSGTDYSFVTSEEFKKLEKAGELLEVAEVFGNWYGTPRKPVEESVKNAEVIVMDIDTVGALRIRQLMSKDSVLVFIVPPSIEELESRLRRRGKNTSDELERRLKEARREISQSKDYDYLLCNLDFDRAYEQLCQIVMSERLRAFRQSALLV